jgi:hypothetical protein
VAWGIYHWFQEILSGLLTQRSLDGRICDDFHTQSDGQPASVSLTLFSMTWVIITPNMLIGLREGLEAGLAVSILLAAVRKAGPAAAGGPGHHRQTRKPPTAPIWLGVLAAVTLSGSFVAVLNLCANGLSSRVQEVASGLLSVLAVVLVTPMIFWMRRTGPAWQLSRAVRWGRSTRCRPARCRSTRCRSTRCRSTRGR